MFTFIQCNILVVDESAVLSSGTFEGGGSTGAAGTTNNSSGGLVQTLEGGVVTKRSSRIAGLSKKDESELLSTNLKR